MLKATLANKNKTLVTAVKLQRGIALLESMIALLIFSFGILAIAGLQGHMVSGTAEAKNRSEASFIAQRRVAMMWANPANLAGFAEVDSIVPELPNGLRTTVVTSLPASSNATVAITITWQSPGQSRHNYSTNALITGCNLAC
jgi:type IV pilus assembly protein PilV